MKLSLEPAARWKLANVDTVLSVLETKGRDIVSVSPTATAHEAIMAMASRSVGALLVTDGQNLAGIVSERDYARRVILPDLSPAQTLVREIMTPSPITVSSAHMVDHCMRIMTENHIRPLPVVENDELLGVVSMGDLVKAIISAQAYTIDELQAYIDGDYPS